MSAEVAGPWLRRAADRADGVGDSAAEPIRLFCLPHAGSGPARYLTASTAST
jgi:hypothetical protein